MTFPKKNSVFGRFPSLPPMPPPSSKTQMLISEQLPCRSAEVKFFSVFLCQRCREIWREILVKFSALRFPGFGCATENFTKISRQKRCEKRKMGSQHPSPNVKHFCKFEPQIWLEICTSRDAKSACLKGSRTSCREIIFGIYWPNFGSKRSHHVMDVFCRIANTPKF